MSTIKQLIQQYCPDGVEYKKLGDIAEIGTGSQDRKDSVDNGLYPFYVRSKEILRINDYLFDEEAVIIPGEGGIGDIFHYVNGKYGLHQRAYRIHVICDGLDTKFLYYYFGSAFKDFIKKKAVSATVTSIRKPMLEQFDIPVPPLPVQHKIVEILDKFTELIVELQVELQAELQARRLQYSYYRNKLLDFKEKDGVEWKMLGEIMDISRGASPRPIKRYLTNDSEGINWIKIGDVEEDAKYITSTKEKITKDGASKSRYLHKGDFILSNSMSFGRPYILAIDGCIHDGWISMSNFEEHVISDYLYYVLKSDIVQKYWKKKSSTGTVSNLNADIVRQTSIPVPPLAEQRRIVAILDRFEALVNDLGQGIPAEIEARQQQYEYYRDRLLTFRRAGA